MIAGYLFYDQVLKERKPVSNVPMEKEWKTSIAVLLFEDLSIQGNNPRLCEGLTDEIIVKLSISCPELRVLPWVKMKNYNSSRKSPQKMGKELGVRYLLAPTLKSEGEKIRITGQLIDTDTGDSIESFEGSIEDNIFRVTDSLSKKIASVLNVKLLQSKLNAEKVREPDNTETFENFRWGRYFEERYRESHTEEDFKNGVEHYKLAMQNDSGYAKAYWGLGNLHEARYAVMGAEKDLQKMYENYSHAYNIDPDLALANIGLGWVYFFRGDNDEAFSYFKRAVDIDSYDTEVNSNVGHFFRSIGLFKKAVKYYLKVLDVNPLDNRSRSLLLRCYMFQSNFEEAILQGQKLLDAEPDNDNFILLLARVFALKKDQENADIQLNYVEKRAPDNELAKRIRALIYASRGEKEKALPLIKNVHPVYSTYLISPIYSLLGMEDEAIQNIKEGISRGFSDFHSYLYSYPILMNNPCYDNLRDDERFQEILKKEKERYEENQIKYKDL
jgi:TolB-like protein/Tfp pilus assembly protein PilF